VFFFLLSFWFSLFTKKKRKTKLAEKKNFFRSQSKAFVYSKKHTQNERTIEIVKREKTERETKNPRIF